MSFGLFLSLMSLGTAMAWSFCVYILYTVNPFEAGFLGVFLFYVTLFLGMLGFLTVAEIAFRVIALKRSEVLSREVSVSFRHAFFLAVLSVLSLFLSSFGMLYWWVILLMVTAMAGLEYLALLSQKSRRA